MPLRRRALRSLTTCNPTSSSSSGHLDDPDLPGLLHSSPVPYPDDHNIMEWRARCPPQETREELNYCTQGCLLGLRTKGKLDSQCPNIDRHRLSQPTNRHLIDQSDLVRLLKQQLYVRPDYYCEPHSPPSSKEVPLKITLIPQGYTLIGKGTTAILWPETRREADVYQDLRTCQGSAVPVFLGALDLHKTFFMHPSTCIRHMLLLSYAGEPVDLTSFNSDKVLVEEEKRSAREIRKHEVRYRKLLLGRLIVCGIRGWGAFRLVGCIDRNWLFRNWARGSSGGLRKRSLGVGGSREKRVRGV